MRLFAFQGVITCRFKPLTAGSMPNGGHDLTPDDGRKGGIRSGEVRRERGKSLRERLSDRLDEEADRVIGVFLDALEATAYAPGGEAGPIEYDDHRTRLAAAKEAINQAHGMPTNRTELSGGIDLALAEAKERLRAKLEERERQEEGV